MSNETVGAQASGMSYSGLLPCDRSSDLLGMASKESVSAHTWQSPRAAWI